MTAVRRVAGVLAVGVAGLIFAPAGRAADPEKVSAAISRGAAYLKASASPARGYTGGNHGNGAISLCGVAMLAAGAKADDPAVASVAQVVRANAIGDTKTYNTALAIIFLDQLGDAADVPLIQYLGVRLYEGLGPSGGWGYECGEAPQDAARLLQALQTNTLTGRSGGGPDPAPSQPKKDRTDPGFPQAKPKDTPPGQPADAAPGKMHPEAARYYAAVRQKIAVGGRPNLGAGDNSNTQFGLIGLWVASRHGVPADDAFAMIEARFLSTQNPVDFGWSYSGGPSVPGMGSSTASMTCAGLLGLAVGQGRRAAPKAATKRGDPPPGSADDPFYNPKKKEGGEGDKGTPAPATRKPAIANALRSLGGVLRATGANAPPAQPGVPAQGGLKSFAGLGDEYYLLWSIERVAVVYGLDTIGDVDWHDWGCNFLIPAQSPDGSWSGSYGPDVATSFALLFLTRSNLVRDLSKKLGGQIKDPGKAELRGDRNKPPLFAPQVPGGSSGSGQPKTAPATTPQTKPEPTPALPPVAQPADPLADALVAAAGADFDAKLQAVRDAKGSEHTAAIMHAIPRLDAARQKQARDALAERMARMTATTLRAMLKEDNAELRRAACLACAMKDDKSHVPDLIERVTDPSDLVVRAARAGLKSLTERDFGPPAGADDAAKAKAKADWLRWYESAPKP